MSPQVKITIKEIVLFERDVTLRMPFRFGIVTLREAPQLFVKVTIEAEDGRVGEGFSAEVLAPKWFDKNPNLSNQENFEQLRVAVRKASKLYSGESAKTPFQHFAENYDSQMSVAEDQLLVASFGQAILDRAILDAYCRLLGVSFFTAIRENKVGLVPHPIIPDLNDTDIQGILAQLTPSKMLEARHTVGLVDPLDTNLEPVADGLPETLEQVIETYGHRYFKIKVNGDQEADIARLKAISKILDHCCDDYKVTLDGNEQFRDADHFLKFYEKMASNDALRSFSSKILYLEQPIARATALSKDISAISSRCPVIIDESDSSLDAFPRAVELGYRGVSTKSCKGFYKSLINFARCVKMGPNYFLSAEDLTMQAGVGVQQDLALVSLLGLKHVERNGHHYVDGFHGASKEEQQRFLIAHPSLYHEQDGVVRLRIEAGKLDISSLDCIGFATDAVPDLSEMRSVAL